MLSGSGSGRSWLACPVWARRLATTLYFIALNWLLLAPSSTFEEVGELFPHQDKIVHVALFLVFGTLVRWSLSIPDGAAKGRLATFAMLFGYPMAIEALQPLIGGAGRQFDGLDLVANVVGVGCGWLLRGAAAGYYAQDGARE